MVDMTWQTALACRATWSITPGKCADLVIRGCQGFRVTHTFIDGELVLNGAAALFSPEPYPTADFMFQLRPRGGGHQARDASAFRRSCGRLAIAPLVTALVRVMTSSAGSTITKEGAPRGARGRRLLLEGSA